MLNQTVTSSIDNSTVGVKTTIIVLDPEMRKALSYKQNDATSAVNKDDGQAINQNKSVRCFVIDTLMTSKDGESEATNRNTVHIYYMEKTILSIAPMMMKARLVILILQRSVYPIGIHTPSNSLFQ
ncbi:hypothetical protein Golomagni_04639 [Golovinomyces magnicellulatus]|nr:hypothetical protein Golomagni_04639 [Golovinomyces magnicellulatus]